MGFQFQKHGKIYRCLKWGSTPTFQALAILNRQEIEMSNVVFFPVQTLKQVNDLDDKEVMQGYMLGMSGSKKPTSSLSMLTGWQNAMVDKGRIKKSNAQKRIAREYIIIGGRGE